jgi:hypothetical protein
MTVCRDELERRSSPLRLTSPGNAFVCSLLLVSLLMSCRGENSSREPPQAWLPVPKREVEAEETRPPDLTRCTRMEVQYNPSTLEYFFVDDEVGLLSAEELKYVRSLRTVVIEDAQIIHAISCEIRRGRWPAPGLCASSN